MENDCDNCYFCCDCNFNSLEAADYENVSCKALQAETAFDSDAVSDAVSVCSSCYHTNCTICRHALVERYRIATPPQQTQLDRESSSHTFDAKGLRKLLRYLDGNVSMGDVLADGSTECGLLCCQGEDLLSTHTSNTTESRHADSGVGRTDDSLRHDDSSEQVCGFVLTLAFLKLIEPTLFAPQV